MASSGRPLQIACNGIEQFVTRFELDLNTGDQVFETTGKRIGCRIAAHFQYVCTSASVYGFTL